MDLPARASSEPLMLASNEMTISLRLVLAVGSASEATQRVRALLAVASVIRGT